MSAEDELRAANPDRVRIYDARIDDFRFATQDDVDKMAEVVQAYGRLVEFFKTQHAQLGKKLGWQPEFPRINRV